MKNYFMSKKLISVLLFLSVICILTSCAAIIKNYINKNVEVPADFGKENATILVVKWKKFYNKKLEKDFKKYYTGDYLFVSKEEVETKYTDLAKYRYIFGNSLYVTKQQSTGPGTGSASSGLLTFHLRDRITNKVYDTQMGSGVSWNAGAIALIQKLEKAKEQNKK